MSESGFSQEDDRLGQVVQLIVELANGKLDARGVPAGSGDDLDAVIVGLNMLGEEFSAAYSKLEEVSRWHKLILETAGEGIYGLDSDGCATFVNPAAARLTGHRVDELIGQHVHDLVHHSRVDGSSYPEEECPVSISLRSGVSQRVSDEVFWRKDGTSFWVEYTSAPIVEGDKVVGAVVTFTDVSERRAVEKMKDEFISVVSHELRTPLTSIRGSLGLLAGGALGQLTDKGRRMLDIALWNSERLVRLINDVLDIERMESGKLVMHSAACSASELIAQAIEEMKPMCEEAGVSLSASSTDAKVWADPDRALQVLTNLLSNAVKFSPPQTIVRLNAQSHEGEVLFKVEDEGRGIPADKLEAIFGRFQQIDASDSRQKGGTGLGLAICKSIVAHHGGRIWVESQEGKGSTFFFTLPAVRDAGPDRMGPGGIEPSAQDWDNGSRRREPVV